MTLHPFYTLSEEEKKHILAWRNHPDVRNRMITSDEISLKNHLQFIDSLKTSHTKRYFLVKEETPIGVIYCTDITSDEACIGLYADPNQKRKGDLLMQALLSYAFDVLQVKKVTLEVFDNNKKALLLYDRFGFMITKEKNHLIYMEKIDENS